MQKVGILFLLALLSLTIALSGCSQENVAGEAKHMEFIGSGGGPGLIEAHSCDADDNCEAFNVQTESIKLKPGSDLSVLDESGNEYIRVLDEGGVLIGGIGENQNIPAAFIWRDSDDPGSVGSIGFRKEPSGIGGNAFEVNSMGVNMVNFFELNDPQAMTIAQMIGASNAFAIRTLGSRDLQFRRGSMHMAHFDENNDFIINNLEGAGNAYSCINSSGKLYRSKYSCNRFVNLNLDETASFRYAGREFYVQFLDVNMDIDPHEGTVRIGGETLTVSEGNWYNFGDELVFIEMLYGHSVPVPGGRLELRLTA